MRPKRHKYRWLAVCALLAVWCVAVTRCTLPHTLQDHYLLPQYKWDAAQHIPFSFSTEDSLTTRSVWLDLRVNHSYPLPYVCVKVSTPAADDRLYWLFLKDGQGKGNGLMTDYRFALDPFCPQGISMPYTWVLSQATSKEALDGVVSVGLCIAPQTEKDTK